MLDEKRETTVKTSPPIDRFFSAHEKRGAWKYLCLLEVNNVHWLLIISVHTAVLNATYLQMWHTKYIWITSCLFVARIDAETEFLAHWKVRFIYPFCYEKAIYKGSVVCGNFSRYVEDGFITSFNYSRYCWINFCKNFWQIFPLTDSKNMKVAFLWYHWSLECIEV